MRRRFPQCIPSWRRLVRPRALRGLAGLALIAAPFADLSSARAAADSPLPPSSPSPPSRTSRETGRPLLRQFSFRDFNAHHQVWVAAEDDAGLLYFGNKGCVLEYDGASWRTIPVPDTTFVRGLASAADGRIYVGAVDQLGYLARNAGGERVFVSLRDQLPEAYRQIGDIWQTVVGPDGGIYFAASHTLLRWRDERFHVWPFPDGMIAYVFRAGDRLFFHRRGDPLQVVQGDSFVPFADGPDLRAARVRNVLELDADRVLAFTANRGVLAIDRAGNSTPFPTAGDGWLREATIQMVGRTSDQLVVLSPNDGAMLLDARGGFVRRFDTADGLRDPQAKSVLESRDGSAWLSLNNGIAQLSAPFAQTFFSREQGLDGTTVRAVTRLDGTLYVATGNGVQRLAPAVPGTLTNARFSTVQGLDGRYFSLLAVPGGLLAGELEHLYWMPQDGGPVQTLATGPSFLSLLASPRTPGRVYAGTSGGVMVLDRTAEGWRTTRATAALEVEARSMVETDDGSVWLGTFTRGVLRVRWRGLNTEPEITSLRGTQGLPAEHVSFHVVRAGAQLFANSGLGTVFRWDAARETFTPVTLEPEPTRSAGTPDSSPPPASGWLVSPTQAGAPESVREFRSDGRVHAWSFPEMLRTTGPLQQSFAERAPDGSRVLWLAGSEGLGRIELDAPTPPRPAPGLAWRSARFDGNTEWPQNHFLPAGPHRLEFAYSASATARAPEFSSRLEGHETDWSPWSANRAREFTNLPAGDYVFRVRTRDGEQPGSRELAFPFQIGAPWWQRWWARGLAVLVGAAGIAGLVRWRLAALRRRAAELERTITRRTAELKTSNEQLLVARDAADSASRAKSAFLASMSHELRTPLNAVLGYAQILARDPGQSAGARDRLQVINESGQHLLALINEVLDLARVESGKMSLHLAPCALPELLQNVAAMMRGPCEAAGLAFEFHADAALPARVQTDEQKLRQVLLNLLGNAVKFTPRGGVQLRVEVRPENRVRFAVADTGPGIAPERQEEIFQPFATSMKDGAQGTGLGLALSQRIVELLGGTLRVESKLGHGARFSFELLLPEATEATGPATRLRTERERIGYEGPRRRVLVVDDEPHNRAVLRELLTPLGFVIDEAHDAESALHAARTTAPDAVLLDLRFRSGDDGFALARRLRTEPAWRATKLIAVSASVFASDRHEAIAAGCDDFLPKPFQEEQLHSVLGTALQLTWVERARSPSTGIRAPANGDSSRDAPTRLAADLRIELLELARRGDARRLQTRLAELAAAANPPGELAELQELVAGFQMKRLRELLAAERDDPTNPPPPSASAPNSAA